jgi:protein-S-isoprenylcysteine O-methyltransferase Ste14
VIGGHARTCNAIRLISEHTLPPNWAFAAGPFLVILGMFLHYVSDAQKYFILQARKGLMEDGFFARTRNPNYLGEILIYSGFVLALWHWQAALVLAGWVQYFVRNMRRKDKSMSHYPEFAAYKRRTGMLLPALNSSAGDVALQDVAYRKPRGGHRGRTERSFCLLSPQPPFQR